MGLTRVTGSSDNTFDNVADMVAAGLKVGNKVRTLGYYSAGDGGGNDYEIVAAATGTADGGSYIDLTTHQAKGLFVDSVVSIKQFGAKGDSDETTGNGSDDTVFVQAAHDFCDTDGHSMLIPSGIYRLTSSITGPLVPISGEDAFNSTLFIDHVGFGLDFSNAAPSVLYTSIENLRIVSTAQYSGGKAISIVPAYNTILKDLYLKNLSGGIYLDDCWCSRISSVRCLYVVDPLHVEIANGVLIEHFYAQRFQGDGIKIVTGLTTVLQGIILENGESSANGVNFQACQSPTLTGLYTEGEMGVDILFSIKNSRRTINAKVEGLWLNSKAPAQIIDAYYSRGLVVNRVTLQTPIGTHLLRAPDIADEITYVSNVVQVDQNYNSFAADRRDPLIDLIPISDDNTRIRLTSPTSAYGDGTQADDTNIQNNTAEDSAGWLPQLQETPVFEMGATPSTFTIVSSSTRYAYGAPANGIKINAANYCSIELNVTGTVTSTGAVQPFFFLKLVNLTTSEDGTIKNDTVTSSGDPYTKTYRINLAPGENELQFNITREQSTAGTNTFLGTLASIVTSL